MPATITVRVTDVNEPPVVPSTTRSISENNAVGAALDPPIEAVDPEGDALRFEAVDNGSTFVVDPTTGAITANKELDFEARASYRLAVVVTETSTSDRLSAAANLTIKVLDIVAEIVYKNSGGGREENIRWGKARGEKSRWKNVREEMFPDMLRRPR